MTPAEREDALIEARARALFVRDANETSHRPQWEDMAPCVQRDYLRLASGMVCDPVLAKPASVTIDDHRV